MALSFKEWLNEAINNSNADRASKLIQKYLTRRTGMKFVKMPGVEEWKNSSGRGYGIRYFYDGKKCVRFNWKSTSLSAAALVSVDIWDGTKRDPKWNIEFDEETSLVTILPFVADCLSGPIKLGVIEIIPEDRLNEEVELELLEESYEDVYGILMKHLHPNTQISPTWVDQKLGWRGYKIFQHLRKAYPTMFSKEGRRIVFVGTTADIKVLEGARSKVLAAIGAVKATVKPGGTNESYKVSAQHEAMDKNLERIAYEDQLHDMENLIRLVVKGASNAIFIAGRGGIGKTHTVEKTLQSLGLHDGEGYFKLTGDVSPVGIYKTLFKHRKDVVLFDDADGALADQVGRNLIKAATDTKKTRKLVWMKASKNLLDPDVITDEDIENGMLPTHFEFEGRVIFISNLHINKLDPDGALRTRALMISIDPTDEEVFKFMEKICLSVPLDDGLTLSDAERLEVIDLLRKNPDPGSVNIRKMVRGLNIRAAAKAGGVQNWQRIISMYA